MAADTVSGYIKALLEGAVLAHTSYALDRGSRKAALARFLAQDLEGSQSSARAKKLAA
jgi:hypothetical protein